MAKPASGNQAVFSGIGVSIRVFGSDFVDPSVLPNAGVVETEPALRVAVGARVVINGGTAAGRVPGLTIRAVDRELTEVGSAALAQSFSFEHRPLSPAHGQSLELEFRYQGSSFSLDVTAPAVAITSPAAGQVVAADQPVVLQWSGIAQPPGVASVTPRIGRCAIAFTRVGDATFVPSPHEGETEHEPPCLFQASAEWAIAASAPTSPFASLDVTRLAKRIQRFVVG